MKPWHERMLAQLTAQLEPDPDVVSLALFGSAGGPEAQYDQWSDIDLLIVLRNDALERYFPAVDWISTLGALYTYDQSADEFRCTTRAVFENLERVDFVLASEEKVQQLDRWASHPFACGTRFVFSRASLVEAALQRRLPPKGLTPIDEDRFLELVRSFRFKAVLAACKVVRGDLLVGLHLSQDLVRDCCVLGMLLRDRATGTNVHRHGGTGNLLVTELDKTQKPFTPIGILESIEESNKIFEKLACEWSSTYQSKSQGLSDWIQKAKTELQK